MCCELFVGNSKTASANRNNYAKHKKHKPLFYGYLPFYKKDYDLWTKQSLLPKRSRDWKELLNSVKRKEVPNRAKNKEG